MRLVVLVFEESGPMIGWAECAPYVDDEIDTHGADVGMAMIDEDWQTGRRGNACS